jgi:hypothetical protein
MAAIETRVTKYVALVFGVGVAGIVAGGLTWGFDATTVIILAMALGVAAVGLGVARKFASGTVAPAQCPECGGVIAPSAPYCKHCGARR